MSLILENLEVELERLQTKLRDGIAQTDRSQERALLETSAEVLGGLRKAFSHCQLGSEQAWINS
ncbi:MAG: hypothetical protein KC910_05760 [Candidatus Eremiobacteraeota bacterium]|nr:hypothetical protein [Candidatus Eremiobacteraeota bacterium]